MASPPRRKTRRRFDMPGHVHYVTFSCFGRKPFLKSTRAVHILYQVKRPVTTWAVGWLHRNAPESLSVMAHRNRDGKTVYRFWLPGGGYDRNMRSASDVHEKINYPHANPVRRGLVVHPRDWAWSSWRAWHEGTDSPLPVDRDTLPPLVS